MVTVPSRRQKLKLQTRVFELCGGRYKNVTELAQAMGLDKSYVYRVRMGLRSISEKFIIGAVKAFPGYKLDDLFYVVKEGHERAIVRPRVITAARRDELVKLRETGLSYAEIGRRLGISRERVRQLFTGRPTPQKPDLDSKVMLTTPDVAQLLGIHHNTVRRWSRTGILKAYHIGPRGDWRFKREDIDSFIKEAEYQ